MTSSERNRGSIEFCPIPSDAFVIITTHDSFVPLDHLISLATHLSIDNPDRQVRYLIEIRGAEDES